MKTIAAFPLLAIALTACDPYYGAGQPQPYPQDPQGYPQQEYPPYPDQGYPPPGYPPYPDQGYPPPGPPMPPGPTYPGPGQPSYPQPGYPQPSNPSGQTNYRAIGTEPFWDLEIGRQLIFTDRGNNVSVAQPTPAPIQGTAGPTYRTGRLEVNIVHRQCNDGMSDRSYPDTVDVRVDGRQRYRGCGAPIEYFTQVGEDGQPNTGAGEYPSDAGSYPPGNYPPSNYPPSNYPPGNYPPGTGTHPGPGMPVVDLTGTNWRVLSINGTRTPASNFYVNFMPGRIGAKFGCNSLGASYTQAGSILSVGAVAATRMACPDMSFENQGSRILRQPLTISGLGERISLSNDQGTIELVRAR